MNDEKKKRRSPWSATPIAQYDLKTGECLATYPSIQAAHLKTGISRRRIVNCAYGRPGCDGGGFDWDTLCTYESEFERDEAELAKIGPTVEEVIRLTKAQAVLEHLKTLPPLEYFEITRQEAIEMWHRCSAAARLIDEKASDERARVDMCTRRRVSHCVPDINRSIKRFL